MEKRIDLSLPSFLENTCLLKIDLPSVFPDLLLSLLQRRSKAWQEISPTQERERQGKEARDHSAAVIKAALYPDAWVKYGV